MIKKALLVLFLSCTSLFYSHDYYFAFAEVEFDELNKEIQATVIVSTHDFENILREKGIINRDLASYSNNPEILKEIQNELLNGFSIQLGTKLLDFNLEGMEVSLTGITNFYFSAREIESTESFQVKFDLLMNKYSEQQNKLTFIYRNTKNTYVFLSNKTEQDIILREI